MGDEAINLRDQVAVVRRRWRIVALVALAGLATGLALALTQSPMYRASARLELTPMNAAQTASNGLVMQPAEIATQVQVLLSEPVAQRVIKSVGLGDITTRELLSSISVEQEGETRVVSLTALRPSAEQARAVADAMAVEYLAFRKEQATEQSRAAVAALDEEASRVRERLSAIQDEIDSATGSDLTALQSEQQALLVELTQILSDAATAKVNSPGALGDGGQVLVSAELPKTPAEPKPLQAGLLGLFAGLVLGIGLAFVRDHFDDGVRDEYRLREVMAPRPVLARIPHWANARTGRLVTVLEPSSPAAEAYRALSTSVRFMLAVTPEHAPAGHGRDPDSARRSGKVLMVTSALEAEGKTSVASNLAVVAARFGLRVVLVDADLRNPQVAEVFGLGRPPGLSDLLASDDAASDYLIDVEDMLVLAGGSLAPNPAELLASPRMGELLDGLATRADLVIVDTAPVTRVSDALELISACDLVLLAVRHGQTRLRSVEEAIEQIHQVGGQVSAAVYVEVPTRSGSETYGYGYQPEADPSGDHGPEPPLDLEPEDETPPEPEPEPELEPVEPPRPARPRTVAQAPAPFAKRGEQISLSARLGWDDETTQPAEDR